MTLLRRPKLLSFFFIDNHLSFSQNMAQIILKINSRLYLLRNLEVLGMDVSGLKLFYCSNIESILTYVAPAWYFLLSENDKDRLEKVQRAATRLILPDTHYFLRLQLLNLPTLNDFIFNTSRDHFSGIANNMCHPWL